MTHLLSHIVSGGQTGVDRAALDAALEVGIPIGGWCPKGRLAEDGRLHARYPLKETPSREYAERTEWNVRDSDGTLILCWGKPTGGTLLTLEFAKKMTRPFWVVDFGQTRESKGAQQWIEKHAVSILNVAGPRGSSRPEVYASAFEFLKELFRAHLS